MDGWGAWGGDRRRNSGGTACLVVLARCSPPALQPCSWQARGRGGGGAGTAVPEDRALREGNCLLTAAHSCSVVVALSPQGQVCLSAKPKLLTFLMCACAPSLTRAALGPCWACAPGVVGRRLSNWSLRRNHRKAFLLPRLLGLPSGFLIQQVLGGARICLSDPCPADAVLLLSPRTPRRP